MSMISSFKDSGVTTVAFTRGATSDAMKQAVDESFKDMNVGFSELHNSHAHLIERSGKKVLRFVPKGYYSQSAE